MERKKIKTLTMKQTGFIILAAGMVLRIAYAVFTEVTVRSHDLWELLPDATGKAGYILHIIMYGALPEGYDLQLYQQPLFFLLSAFAGRMIQALTHTMDYGVMLSGAKIVSCMASCLTLGLMPRLCKTFGIQQKHENIVLAIVAFTPVFCFTGGRVSEESLLYLWMTLAVLFTLYWEKNSSWKNTITLAVIYGLGMMTKISMAVPAMFTLVVFLKKIKETDRSAKGRVFLKLLLFGCISFPLGLWFNIRNFVLFGQPLGYVLEQSVEGPLYTGNASLVQRFFSIDIGNLLKSPFTDVYSDVNLPVYLLKSEVFGEFSYQVPIYVPIILLFCNVILTLYVVIECVKGIRRKQNTKEEKLVIQLFLLWIGFAAVSYLSQPFGCTMDFRYYAMLSVWKALIIAKSLEQSDEQWLLEIGISRKRTVSNVIVLFSFCATVFMGYICFL